MTENNLIQWPRAKYWDKAWNAIIGCKPCSPACEHCYAAAWAERFHRSFAPTVTNQRPPRRGVVFCGNMTDLFGEWVSNPEIYIKVTGERFVAPTATYLYLTKRVERLCRALCNGMDPRYEPFREDGYMARNYYMRNHYFGYTVENQGKLYERMGGDYMPTWANKWLSCEPLLGPLELPLRAWRGSPDGGTLFSRLKWVVVGCESGPNRRPCKLEWVEGIVEQCRAASVPVFVKQICLPNGKFTNKIEEFPEHLRIRQVPWATTTTRG